MVGENNIQRWPNIYIQHARYIFDIFYKHRAEFLGELCRRTIW